MKNAHELYAAKGLTLIARSPRVRQTGYPPLSIVLCYDATNKRYVTQAEALLPSGDYQCAGVQNEFVVGRAKGADARAFAKAVDDYVARGARLGAFQIEKLAEVA